MPRVTRRQLLSSILAGTVTIASPRWGIGAESDGPPPNFVFILADDLGWGDVGYHGSEIKTPHIDGLATSGVRLNQFYVQPVCTPTRAALLTGRYPIQYGLQGGVIFEGDQFGLPLEERTLPEALKSVGYRTAICGKWHLGHHHPHFLPTRRGFDYQYGSYNHALDYFTHTQLGGLDWHRNDRALYQEGYTTTLIGEEAAQLIEAHDPSQPLFLYVPFNAPHDPLQAPEPYIDMYSHITDEKRRLYAAMVTCLDDAVGRIVTSLQTRGIRQNTLIIFSSDNGGWPEAGASNGRLRGEKGSLYEGGIRVPAFANWPGVLQTRGIINEPLHIVDWYPTLLQLAAAPLSQPLPLDGRDAWATISQGGPSPHVEILHNATKGMSAIRRGDWKLILQHQKESQSIELFNIATDPFEKNNIATQHPDQVKALSARLKSYGRDAVPPPDLTVRPDQFKVPKVWGVKAPLLSALWKLRIGLLLLFGILWGTQRWLEKRRVKPRPTEQPRWREKCTQIVKAIFGK